MEEKFKIIPLGINFPYTIEDLSVVIPHASWYKKRLSWFLERYFKGTPAEVIKNTYIIYDPDDLWSLNEIQRYDIKAILNKQDNRDYSTLKMQVGFDEVKTRLCARLHNDGQIMRSDWADQLIKQFNSTKVLQLIGTWHPSGDMGMADVDKFNEFFPWFASIKDKLEPYTTDQGVKRIGTEYLHAFFMAGQTYIFRDLYPQVIKYNEEKMDKEDILFSQLVSSHNIQLTSWNNMYKFVNSVGVKSGDFEEGDNINKDMPVIITSDNQKDYPEPEWKVVE